MAPCRGWVSLPACLPATHSRHGQSLAWVGALCVDTPYLRRCALAFPASASSPRAVSGAHVVRVHVCACKICV